MAIGDTVNAGLLRADFSPIERGGAAKGQAYRAIGQGINSAIEKYQLNKEKQKKNEGFIKSQSGMLDMLAEQDPEMAPQYAAMKEQLNNPDVPLATRAEFGKNLVNNITLSTQLKGQKLLQATQAQTLKEKTDTEDLRKSLLQQKETYNNLGIELQQLAVTKGKELNAAEIKNLLAKYGLSDAQIEAEEKLLPLQTTDKKEELAAKSRDRKIVDEVIDQLGGIKGAASKRVKDSNLASAKTQSEIDYRNNVGLAQLYKSLAEKNPTFAEQFTPLATLQDKLRGLTVKTPKGESVTYAEYEKLHNEDPELYPMNNEPGAIRGQIESVNSQIYNLSREQTVQVNVPDEVNVQSEQAPSTIPPYKQALQKIGEDTQKEYMNTLGVGGYGFPFMP